MAEFAPAFKLTMKYEGGYANDKSDRGGETYRGISRNNWRGWEGWALVDGMKANKEFPRCLDYNAELQAKVETFYRRNFWMPIMAEIKDQALVDWLFDKGVNMGIQRAYKLLQRALHVDQDGVIGPQTRAMIQQSDPVQLLADCRDEAKRFYTNLALKDPSQSKFLHGWLARA